MTLPLVDRDQSAAEWAAQQPLPQYGRDPYGAGASNESPGPDPYRGIGLAGANGAPTDDMYLRRAQAYRTAANEGFYDRGEPAPVSESPYVSPTSSADLDAQLHHAILVAPTSPGTFTDSAAAVDSRRPGTFNRSDSRDMPVHALSPDAQAEEIAGAVSVAVAYFEDTLGAAPQVLLNAGSLGCRRTAAYSARAGHGGAGRASRP